MAEVHPLRAFRKRQQPPLSQQGLADLLDVRRPTVTRWETGVRKVDADLLPKVAERTGIPTVQLRPDLAALMQPPERAS